MEKEYEAKTVEEAIELACRDFEVSKDEIDHDVVQESTHGFFGIGSKNAIVKIRFNDNYNKRLVENFISNILKFYDQNSSVRIEVLRPMTVYSVKIEGENPLSELIGKHGRTLGSLEHLTSVYLNKKNDHHISVFLDVNDYKVRREDIIRKMVGDAVAKVKRGTRRVSLEPMNSHERKIVHEILSSYGDIKSYSVGIDPYRHVVIEKSKVKVKE